MTPPQITPPMQEHQQESPPAAPSSQVPWGTLCIKCGYLLDGLTTDDVCSECGTPCEHSCLGVPLDSGRVKTIFSSCRLLLLGFMIQIGGGLLGFIGILTMRGSGTPRGVPDWDTAVLLAGFSSPFVLGSLVTSIGLWRGVASPFPAGNEDIAGRSPALTRSAILVRESSLLCAFSLMLYQMAMPHDLSWIINICFVLWIPAQLFSHYFFCRAWELRAGHMRQPGLGGDMRDGKNAILYGTLCIPFTLGGSILLIVYFVYTSAYQLHQSFRSRLAAQQRPQDPDCYLPQ
jgi:hypothetical protein